MTCKHGGLYEHLNVIIAHTCHNPINNSEERQHRKREKGLTSSLTVDLHQEDKEGEKEKRIFFLEGDRKT